MSQADRSVAWAALAFGLFYIYGSLAPLEVQTLPIGLAWDRFVALPAPWEVPLSRVDVAVNVLLTVPLAFAAAHLAGLVANVVLRWTARVLAPLALSLLAVCVEWSQIFVPGRDPSWSDVTSQWVGIGVGTVLYAIAGPRWRALLSTLETNRPLRGRVRTSLALYVLGMLAYAVMPLDLSISPVELYRKWRDGRVVLLPMLGAVGSGWQFAYDLATDVGLWLPVGALWRMDDPAIPARRLFARGLFWGGIVELAQLPVLSRVCDVTDVLWAGCGAALGAGLPRLAARWRAAAPRSQRRAQTGLALAWLLLATTVLWLPFDFDSSRAHAQAWRAIMSEPLGSTYFVRGELGALSEVLRKVLLFAPAGLLLATWRLPVAHTRIGLFALGLLAIAFEAGQALLPARTASMTDALLAWLGAWSGMRVGRGLLSAPEALPPPLPVAQALASGTVPRRREAGPAWPPDASLPGTVGSTVATIAVGGSLLWAFSRLPGVPYNLAKLMPPGVQGPVAALGLAAALWWMLAAPLEMLSASRRSVHLALPVALLGHALVTFMLLRSAVPLEMLHKIIGSPVLGWPWVLEDLARYVALHMAVMLPLLGAAWLLHARHHPASIPGLLAWAFWTMLLAWPVHIVVVEQAGTDNLVELMRGGGSLPISTALACALLLLTLAGGLVAQASLRRRARWQSLCCAAGCLACTAALLQAGLEPVLVKYERVFSSLQFLLSSGRDRYAVGLELSARLAAALLISCGAVALFQRPVWRRLLLADARTSNK